MGSRLAPLRRGRRRERGFVLRRMRRRKDTIGAEIASWGEYIARQGSWGVGNGLLTLRR